MPAAAMLESQMSWLTLMRLTTSLMCRLSKMASTMSAADANAKRLPMTTHSLRAWSVEFAPAQQAAPLSVSDGA